MSNKEETNSSYKEAFKSTSIYGGVQVITILINIIRSKLTALWLGTTGFGIYSVFSATVGLISNLSNLGLASSAVREISQAKSSESEYELAILIKAISRTVVVTGCLGAITMFILSQYISIWTFGNSEYVLAYILLSIVVLLNNIYQGHYAILQGLRLIKKMAVARILGAFLGLLFIIPCYLLGGVKGIVPSLILSSLASLVISKYFTLQIAIPKIKQTWKETIKHSKTALQLGIMLMITGVIASLSELIIKSYITQFGSIDQVGLYQAGWAINVQYLGLIFTAMATDYYPRLTQVFHNSSINKVNETINHQSEIALLIMNPLICLVIVFLPTAISILYTSSFIEVVPMTRLLLIGSLVKAGAWAVSFLFLAAGDGKTYLINEIGIKLFNVPLYLLSYKYFGLIGIGYGYIINYLIYFLWVTIVAIKKYHLRYNFVFFKIIINSLLLAVLSVVVVSFVSNFYAKYIIGILLIIIATIYSFRELDNRLNLKDLINGFTNKFKK